MGTAEPEIKKALKKKQKKMYKPPTLLVYGKMTLITAGGTGQSNEGSMVNELTRRP